MPDYNYNDGNQGAPGVQVGSGTHAPSNYHAMPMPARNPYYSDSPGGKGGGGSQNRLDWGHSQSPRKGEPGWNPGGHYEGGIDTQGAWIPDNPYGGGYGSQGGKAGGYPGMGGGGVVGGNNYRLPEGRDGQRRYQVTPNGWPPVQSIDEKMYD